MEPNRERSFTMQGRPDNARGSGLAAGRIRKTRTSHQRHVRVLRQHLEALLEPQPDAARALRDAADQRGIARLGRVAQRLDYPPRIGPAASRVQAAPEHRVAEVIAACDA